MKLKLITWITAILILLNTVSADIVINQVLYDPQNTESGGEAIEIYNNGNNDIDISSWKIATEASQSDAILPQNTILCPSCYYLIADKGWNISRDNMSWPEADLEEPLTMYNSDSGIALIKNETIIDAVGWGNPDEILEELYEGDPVDKIKKAGNSILRINNANNNKFDFEETIPFFRSSSNTGTGTSSETVNIEFEISNETIENSENQDTVIDFINVSKTKITPIPGGTSLITVNAQITGYRNNVTATLMKQTKTLASIKQVNATTSIFSTSFELDFFVPPGKYKINVSTEDETMEISFEYLKLIAIETEKSKIDFDRISSEKDYIKEIKVKNIGNAPVDLGIKGLEFNDFDINNIQYSINNKYYNLSSNTAIRSTALIPGKETSIKIKINTPKTTKTGKYDGKFEITAIGIEN